MMVLLCKISKNAAIIQIILLFSFQIMIIGVMKPIQWACQIGNTNYKLDILSLGF